MENPCDKNLYRLLELTETMLELADQGDIDRADASCGAVFGQLRDSAYKLRTLAQAELAQHQSKKISVI